MKRKHSNKELADKAKMQIKALEATRRDIDRYTEHLRVHVERMTKDESSEARSLYKQTVRMIKNNLSLTAITFDR